MQEKVWKLYKEGNPYFVSNYGDVFNINKSIFMKKQLDRYGYNYVSLSLNHKKIKKKVHRMVCESFIPNPDNKPQVNHKNGIKTDNRVENLEWATASENVSHCFRVLSEDGHLQKAMSERRKGQKIKPEAARAGSLKRTYGGNGRAKPILCLELNQKFSCQKEASEVLKINIFCIYKAVKTGKAVKGLHFKKLSKFLS